MLVHAVLLRGPMPTEYFLSLLLLVLALFIARRSGRSKLQSALLVTAAVVAVILLIAYAAADYFTGEGMNSAALFHIQYGLRGAGFREYRGLILLCAAGLILAPTMLGFWCFSKISQPRRPRYFAGSLVLILGSFIVNPATRDLIELFEPVAPATEDFLRHYRTPRITATTDDHPNFVFIFAESLERTYFDDSIFPGLIKELRTLENQGHSFTNIHTLEGTGYTVGGIVASLCGVPLFSPAHANSMSGMDTFLPGARGLTDLLREKAGYHFAFMGGAPLAFAGKGKFLKTHGFDEMSGFGELHGRVVDKAYINNWGLYDDTLLDMAFDRFRELSDQGKRFGLFILTLDTHHPDGHVSRTVTNTRYGDGTNTMLNAVAGSDALVAAFVRRIQQSAFGRNTVVVIASDHLAMNNAAIEQLQKGERRNLFLVLDPRNPAGAKIARKGSTLDIGATLLPFLGFKGVIGLGRDLQDAATSDDEIAYIHRKETVPSWRGELMKFWEFPELNESLSFTDDPAEVTLDGRRFSAPVLIELYDDGQTRLRFEFDALWDVRLAQQVKKLNEGAAYILVAKPEDAAALFPPNQSTIETPWVLVVGKAGARPIARPLPTGASFTRAEIDGYLGGPADEKR
jgi:phosphoglycerol transferase